MKSSQRIGLQQEIVKGVKGLSLKDQLTKPTTKLGQMLQNRKVARFERAKLSTLKNISAKQQGIAGRAVEAARDIGVSLIANETAREVANPNSYKNSLAAWTKNISGNPDTSSGSSGETQAGSTSELGG